MGLFDLFKRDIFKKKEPILFPPSIGLALATLTEKHKNASKAIFSPKEQKAAGSIIFKLNDARRAIHQAESAVHVRDFEFAFENIDNAKKNVLEYRDAIAAFPALQPLQPQAQEILQSIETISTQVLMNKV